MTAHRRRALAAGTLGWLAISALAAGAAQAAVVYSDFSPFGPNEDYSGLSVSGIDASAGLLSPAARFTARRTVDLTQIGLAISAVNPSARPVTVSLWTDTGQRLGQRLGVWRIDAPSADENPPPVSIISDVAGIQLDAGQSYYLRVEAADDDLDAWWFNSIGAYSDLLINGRPPPGAHAAPIFQVLGDPLTVPEPSLWASMLLGLGLAGGALRGRRRGQGAGCERGRGIDGLAIRPPPV